MRADIKKAATPEELILTPPDGYDPKSLGSFFDYIQFLVSQIPEEELAKLPIDGADNHDHYIYGTPKRY
ncbi:hypothetical protein BH09SUM1_BH09SUM1_05000 [soil metagenome]